MGCCFLCLGVGDEADLVLDLGDEDDDDVGDGKALFFGEVDAPLGELFGDAIL